MNLYLPGTKLLLLIFVTLQFSQWQIARAYDWDNDYGVNVSVGQENNFRLAATNEIDTTSTRLGVFANLQGSTEISNLRVALGANSSTYSESEIDDSDGYNLSLDTLRRGERLSANLVVSATAQSTTETELLDTGNVIDGKRNTARVSPGLNYLLDERNSLFANLSVSDVTYDTVSLIEYTDTAVSIGWGYALDEASDFSFNLSTSEYDPENDETTDIKSLSFGYEIRTSEVTSYAFSIGYSDVDRPDNSEASGDYAIDINHRTDERNSFVIALSNAYRGGGAGDVRDEDLLSLQWNHALSDRSQLDLLAQAISNDDRDYTSIEFRGGYQYTREVSLGATLRYRRQDSDFADADSSSVFFSLSYSPI